ncbi:MAG TPA: transketolase C-terminal domain-containing protein, partial [Acidimicrobiales bacterium]|nr:transketolase C-terminal domain-containing protein [Acidimicrobiales bacterium]
GDLLEHILGHRSPAMLFEDKLLYRAQLVRTGPSLPAHDVEMVGAAPGTAWCRVPGTDRSDFCLIAPGGVAPRVLEAATGALSRGDIVADVAVPARLYPLDVDALASIARRAERTVVVEEGLPGSSWGSEVAHQLTKALWPLRHPVDVVTSRLSVIPSARHLESQVVVQAGDVLSLMERAHA